MKKKYYAFAYLSKLFNARQPLRKTLFVAFIPVCHKKLLYFISEYKKKRLKSDVKRSIDLMRQIKRDLQKDSCYQIEHKYILFFC